MFIRYNSYDSSHTNMVVNDYWDGGDDETISTYKTELFINGNSTISVILSDNETIIETYRYKVDYNNYECTLCQNKKTNITWHYGNKLSYNNVEVHFGANNNITMIVITDKTPCHNISFRNNQLLTSTYIFVKSTHIQYQNDFSYHESTYVSVE